MKGPIFKKSELLGISITFLVGLFSGWYLYFFGFSVQFSLPDLPTDIFYDDFVIIGEEYGGCSMSADFSCASFQLLADGSYRYVPSLTEVEKDGNGVIVGKIPDELIDDLNELANEESLKEASAEIESDTCVSFVDGIDERYRVTKDGEEYYLDTCLTRLESSRELKTAIDRIWNYLKINN